MFWEEKIDILKKKFSQTDFCNPFTDWMEILKKIESKFIIKDNSDYNYTNWSDNLRHETHIRTIAHDTIYKEIQRLDSNINYWVVIVYSSNPTSKYLVYDCKINSMEALLSLISGDFYIIDKKYKWLTFFNIDKGINKIKIFKSGNEVTPFDD